MAFVSRKQSENSQASQTPVSPVVATRELPRLVGERVGLRLASLQDISQIAGFFSANRENFAPYVEVPTPQMLAPEHLAQQISLDHQEFIHDLSCRMWIELPGEKAGHLIGSVSFFNFLRGPLQTCTLGYQIDQRFEGRSLMREALQLGIGYMFGTQNMHRICANYAVDNQRSAGLLNRLGFLPEGYARDYLCVDGRWRDHILTSRINPGQAQYP